MNDALSYYYYTPTFNVLYTLQEFGGYVCCVVNHMPFVIFRNLQNVQHCSVIFPVFLSQIWALVLNQDKIWWLKSFSFFTPLQGWLQRYGYLPRTEPGISVLRSAQTMHSAIAAMQRVYGLNVTGTLDEKTKEWVYTCVVDVLAQTQTAEQHMHFH